MKKLLIVTTLLMFGLLLVGCDFFGMTTQVPTTTTMNTTNTATTQAPTTQMPTTTAISTTTTTVLTTTEPTTVTTETTTHTLTMYITLRDLEQFNNFELLYEAMVSEILGINLDLIGTTNPYDTLTAISAGQADLALISHYYYGDVYSSGDMQAIMSTLRYDVDEFGQMMIDEPAVPGYNSLILVGADSGITDISDLVGKTIAISSYTSTSGWVWPANLLIDNGINPLTDITVLNAGGHNNAVLAILNGEADAAFVYKDARVILEGDYTNIFSDILVLAETAYVPNDILCASVNLDQSLIEQIQQAFLTLTQDEIFLSYHEQMFTTRGYAITSDEELAYVRLYMQRAEETLMPN